MSKIFANFAENDGMERIKLSKEEKITLLCVSIKGEKKPEAISELAHHYALDTLEEKGLIRHKSGTNGNPYYAQLTTKGKAYIESNPKLKNPVPWRDIILITLSAITAISTMLALFIACTRLI